MPKAPEFKPVAIPLGEFGTSRVESGVYTVERAVYALHPTKDFTKCYLTQDWHLIGEDGDQVSERYMTGFYLTDRNGERLNVAPSPDGVNLAGVEGANDYQTVLDLVTGKTRFAEGEEEHYAGPYLLTFVDAHEHVNLKKLRGSKSDSQQLYEALVKLVGADKLAGKAGLDAFVGYTFEWNREPKLYGKKKDDGGSGGAATATYDPLIPVALVSAPEDVETGGKSSKSSASTATKSTVAAKSSAKGSAGTDDTDTSEIDTKVESTIYGILTSEPMSQKEWLQKATNAADPDLKGYIIQYRNKPEWMYSEDRPWNYDEIKKTLWI